MTRQELLEWVHLAAAVLDRTGGGALPPSVRGARVAHDDVVAAAEKYLGPASGQEGYDARVSKYTARELGDLKVRRERVATQIMAALVSDPTATRSINNDDEVAVSLARAAIVCADALIEELNK